MSEDTPPPKSVNDPDLTWAEFRQRAEKEIPDPEQAPAPRSGRTGRTPATTMAPMKTPTVPPARPAPTSPTARSAPTSPNLEGGSASLRPPLGEASRVPLPAPPQSDAGDATLDRRHTMTFRKVSIERLASDQVKVFRPQPTEGPPDERIYLLRAPDSAVAASFRVLRHRLIEREVKVILVTSPSQGEGKTLTAVNLALALSEAGRGRVLLLEANFRQPALAKLLKFVPPACVIDQLEQRRGGGTDPWAVVETGTPWMHTLAVMPDRPQRLLIDGPALTAGIEDLRKSYDHIVVDSPPILGSADVNLIEEGVDGVLLAMWARRSRAGALRKAIDQIGRSKLLGVALLGT